MHHCKSGGKNAALVSFYVTCMSRHKQYICCPRHRTNNVYSHKFACRVKYSAGKHNAILSYSIAACMAKQAMHAVLRPWFDS